MSNVKNIFIPPYDVVHEGKIGKNMKNKFAKRVCPQHSILPAIFCFLYSSVCNTR